MSFTEMTLSELGAVAIFGLVAVFAVVDGLWPHPRWAASSRFSGFERLSPKRARARAIETG